MKVYINGRFLTQPVSGVQRFARSVLAALDDNLAEDPDETSFEVLVPRGPLVDVPAWKALRLRRVPGGRGHLWEQGALFRASRDGILVSLGNTGPLAHPAHILALHDAHLYQIPEAFSWRYRAVHRFLRPRLARKASQLLTVSDYSARQLSHHLDITPDRFRIVPNAADHVLNWPRDPRAPGRYGLVPGQYLLTVGNQSPNKNLNAVIDAYGLCEGLPQLAIVGGAAPGLTTHAPRGVRALGRVPDADLRGLYEGAAGFVFPSLYEGFGIPPLEAMQLGVPVLSANSAAMPEVLGQAPIWFDPRDTHSIAGALQSFKDLSKAERSALIGAGLERAQRYSWTRSAEDLLEIIRAAAWGSEPLQKHVHGAGDFIGMTRDVVDPL